MRMAADDRMEVSPSDVRNVAALLASDVGTAIGARDGRLSKSQHYNLKDESKVITSQYSSDKGP